MDTHDIADPIFEDLKAHAATLLEATHVPGMALGISHAGRTRTAGFGATGVEHPLPVTPDTLFQLGSISKVYTATAVMRLVEEGRLDLDVPIRTYLPGFRTADSDASGRATLRHALTHQVGWPGDVFDLPEAAYASMAAFMEYMDRIPQIIPPGQIWSYANTGLLVAGRVVEVVTGHPFAQALRALVLEPLGLHHTAVEPGLVMTHRFALGHFIREGRPETVRPWPLPGCTEAEGGVAASIADLLRFGTFHMGDGRADGGEPILSAETLRAMQTPGVFIWPPDERMGLAWFVDERAELRVVAHAGRTMGTQAQITLVPEAGLVFAALTNGDAGMQIIEPLRRAALHAYAGVTLPQEPDPLPATEERLRPYAGRYDHPYVHLEVAWEEGRAVVHFGAHVPVLPAQMPPMACAFAGEDRLIVLEGHLRGAHLDVFRRPDGSIGWLRDGDTLYTRAA